MLTRFRCAGYKRHRPLPPRTSARNLSGILVHSSLVIVRSQPNCVDPPRSARFSSRRPSPGEGFIHKGTPRAVDFLARIRAATATRWRVEAGAPALGRSTIYGGAG